MDDEFGTYAPGWIASQVYAALNLLYKRNSANRLFGCLRWFERKCWGRNGIVDVERHGLRWRLSKFGNATETLLLQRSSHVEVEEIAVVLDTVDKNFVFIDVGANCGLWSVQVAKAIGSDGTVIAIEPLLEMRQRLQFNATINNIRSIDILDCAVGDHAGRAWLEIDERNLGHSQIADAGNLEVKVVPLLEIAKEYELRHINALKVDVEGYEDRVIAPFIRDAPELLLPKMIIAEYSWSDEWVSDWLTGAVAKGYREIMRTSDHNIVLVRDE